MQPQPADVPATVYEVLADGQAQGFIGPGSIEPHVRHALGFLEAIERAQRSTVSTLDKIADLGSGAGLPGLVLASVLPGVSLTLVEGSSRRAAFLHAAIEHCAMNHQVTVQAERAEIVGQDPRFRGQFSFVVARAFGTPSTTAECAAPLLRPWGQLVVSEPPAVPAALRWPAAGIETLGLRLESGSGGYAVLVAEAPCPDRYPRRVGVPRKRPLF